MAIDVMSVIPVIICNHLCHLYMYLVELYTVKCEAMYCIVKLYCEVKCYHPSCVAPR